MTLAGMAGDTDQSGQLKEREVERCDALMRGDASVLEDMLTDDLVHIHLNGKADDKSTYLNAVRSVCAG